MADYPAAQEWALQLGEVTSRALQSTGYNGQTDYPYMVVGVYLLALCVCAPCYISSVKKGEHHLPKDQHVMDGFGICLVIGLTFLFSFTGLLCAMCITMARKANRPQPPPQLPTHNKHQNNGQQHQQHFQAHYQQQQQQYATQQQQQQGYQTNPVMATPVQQGGYASGNVPVVVAEAIPENKNGQVTTV
mmetsp:Transcript_12290/g.21927  ORF Transcript_12290/g.21927 Transcript_12290/m.21927 type:complete len:189 (+) Transcript_12290:366-932(+)|eukprot:CAMPEP_0184524286 /NCGR_PEP_ID=MMETSP0198_2-20121128/9417_1 /TAXON_ID=1112570 /ORGANISM="Thraustochytrium sp., Strain LLF1b" /LENGTH=188 /DNA_ID=CAMNT_0026915535 /DNA_START=351 /DNA_END=917 /DNA_ORIENTATION=-